LLLLSALSLERFALSVQHPAFSIQ